MVGIRNVQSLQTEFLTEEYLCVKKEMPIGTRIVAQEEWKIVLILISQLLWIHTVLKRGYIRIQLRKH